MAPTSFFNRMWEYYTGLSNKDLPIISTSAAAYLSIAYTLIYVIPFYLSSKTRPSPQLSRDAPSVIRARIRAVTLSSIIVCGITTYIASQYGHLTTPQLLHTFGWWPIDALDLLRTFLLVATLFAGPLFERGIVEGEWRDWIRARYVAETFSNVLGWRTFVVGPVSEEFVWRAMIIPLHLFAKISPTKIVFITPLYFGIAHIHHCYEYKLTHPSTPLVPVIFRTLFQFTYTSLFGFYAAFIFLRTGSLWAVIIAHAFCNWMGLPRLWGKVETPVPMAPPDVNQKEDVSFSVDTMVENSYLVNSDLHLGWTIAYYTILILGAFEFYRNLFALSASRNALVPDWP